MADVIQIRRDTAANWASANPVLHQGEKGLETDTGKEKTGDGVTAWNSLAYSLTPLSSTPSAGKVMVWKTGVINASVSTSYFAGMTGAFTLTQINDVLYVRSSIGFTARTITAGDELFTFTGLSVSAGKTVRCMVGVDTTTKRTITGLDINIASNGSGNVKAYPNVERTMSSGTINNAAGLYGDASVYLG